MTIYHLINEFSIFTCIVITDVFGFISESYFVFSSDNLSFFIFLLCPFPAFKNKCRYSLADVNVFFNFYSSGGSSYIWMIVKMFLTNFLSSRRFLSLNCNRKHELNTLCHSLNIPDILFPRYQV